jgi:hypothetical protein
MKKLHIKISLYLLVLLFIVTGCRKDDSSFNKTEHIGYQSSSMLGKYMYSNNTGTVSEEFGLLHFSSKEMFENVLMMLYDFDEPQTKNWCSRFTGFKSLDDFMERVKIEELEKNCHDTKLASILNNESMIWIDSTLFLMDWAKDSIYEAYPVNIKTINRIKEKKEVVDSLDYFVFRYSVYDEVLYPVNENKLTSRAFRWIKKIFGRCKDVSADRRIDDAEIEYSNSSKTSMSKYNVKLVYQPAGLWFSLMVKVKHYTKNENGNYKQSVGAVCSADDYAYRKMCGGSDQNTTLCYNNSPRASVDPKWVRKFYAGMTKLNKYKVTCDLYLEDIYTADDLFSRKEISHNF